MSLEQAKEILGLPRGVTPTPTEVTKAYREKAFQNHPDRGGDTETLKMINVAKDVLEQKEDLPLEGPDGVRQAPYAPSTYKPEPRPKPDPVRITWDEAEAAASVPKAHWVFKTTSAYGGHGDTSMSGFVVVGELGPEKWVFVAVEHYSMRNPFTGEDVDEYWMKTMPLSGALRDVAPKGIRQMFQFPHVSKQFNAKVEILPEGVLFTPKMQHMQLRSVSFKDAMEILGELKDDDPWKGRKLSITMILNRDGYGENAKDIIELVINGRSHMLREDSVEFVKGQKRLLPAIYGTYFYWHGDKKMLTKAKDGKKILTYLAEKLVHEPQQLRDALTAAAGQMP